MSGKTRGDAPHGKAGAAIERRRDGVGDCCGAARSAHAAWTPARCRSRRRRGRRDGLRACLRRGPAFCRTRRRRRCGFKCCRLLCCISCRLVVGVINWPWWRLECRCGVLFDWSGATMNTLSTLRSRRGTLREPRSRFIDGRGRAGEEPGPEGLTNQPEAHFIIEPSRERRLGARVLFRDRQSRSIRVFVAPPKPLSFPI